MSVATTASQILFQASLPDVVRKIRSNKNREREVIEECINDVKAELQSASQNVKVTAVAKLTYFSMLGHSGDFGGFNVIEVMADPLFHNKRIGYVAAAVTFHEDTAVLPLITALLKKDFLSVNQYEVGLGLYCLSCVCNADLARDLVADVVSLLNNQRAYVRKKAVLCLYKIFLQFPDALRLTFQKLKEKIEDGTEKSDNDPAVRGAIINVLCELGRRNPANFLNDLAPPFYTLLSTVHNNWTLIKIIKLFGYFAPLEPRLGKRLVSPITNLINTTSAKSVQYECIYSIANGMSKVPALINLAVDKMKMFVEEHDQNLKYLGLEAMSRVIRENPKALMEERGTILACLDDTDATIRTKALQLMKGLATRKNLINVVNSVFDRVVRDPPDEDWSNAAIKSIVQTVQQDDYGRVQDFEWYIGLLLDLSQIPLTLFRHGSLLENEFITILTRVRAVRQFGVESLVTLLSSQALLTSDIDRSTQWMVLKAAAFACGEYPHWLPNKRLAMQDLLHERIQTLPPALQEICVGAAGKIYFFIAAPCSRHADRKEGEEELELPDDSTTLEELNQVLYPDPALGEENLLRGLMLYCHSVFPDVQEKAQFVHYAIKTAGKEASLFFEADLEAVAEDAQDAVPLPEGLDLSTPFCEQQSSYGESDDSSESESSDDSDRSDNERKIEEQKRRERARRIDLDAFYIKEGEGKEEARKEPDLPPIEKLDDVTIRKTSRRSGGGKSHTISRVLSKPATYTSAQKQQVVVEDEATKKLKNVKIGGEPILHESLPEIKPYQRVDPTQSQDRSEKEAANLSFTAPSQMEAIVIGEDQYCKISVSAFDCKSKKDSLILSATMNVAGLDAKHSMYSTTLFFSTTPEPPGRIYNVDGSSTFAFTQKIENSSSTTAEVQFIFSTVPNFGEPLHLVLKYLRGKNERSVTCLLPLKLRYFLKPPEKISPDDFHKKVLPSIASGTCLSATIPMPRRKPASLLSHLKHKLNMVVVDVLPDCVSLYGQLHGRKVGTPHIAMLLQTSPENTELTVYVKCHLPHVAEEFFQEFGEIAM